MPNPDKFRATEEPEAVKRYVLLKELGRKRFIDSHVVRTGEVNEDDILGARRFLAEAITATNPPVWASWFEHIFIAQELGRKIGDPTTQFLLSLHEIGRLVSPGAYLRNDFINRRLLKEFGIPPEIVDEFFPIERFLEVSGELGLDEEQLRWQKPLSDDQKAKALIFFESLTNQQRITNLADNLGKRNDKGLFDIRGFFQYLQTQEQRYKGESPWPSENWSIPRRPGSAVLQAFIIEETLKWLQNKDVNVESALRELDDYGPKFILVVRHGDPDNPKNIVYNLDQEMKAEDIIHITEYGKEQMHLLGVIIKNRRFRVKSFRYSNQTRAVESTVALNDILKVKDVKDEQSLKDVYAPGAYFEGLTMDDWKVQGGNAYDEKRWGKYNHEKPEKVIERINQVFWENVNGLNVGETVILLSHGDPIAWWINYQVTGKIPQADALRDQIYPNQGQAIVCIIDPQGNFFTHYILTDPSLKEGKMY